MNQRTAGVALALVAAGLLVAALASRAWWSHHSPGLEVRVGVFRAEICRTSRVVLVEPDGTSTERAPGCARATLTSLVGRTFAGLGLAAMGACSAAVFALLGAAGAGAARRSVRGTGVVGAVFSVLALALATGYVLARPAELAGFGLALGFPLAAAGAVLGLIACGLLATWRAPAAAPPPTAQREG
jgi:hypothetical protein